VNTEELQASLILAAEQIRDENKRLRAAIERVRAVADRMEQHGEMGWAEIREALDGPR
jgi:hypothetical protein